MTVNEFYERIGGDYQDIKNRLSNDAIIEKFLKKFLNETSYQEMLAAISKNSIEETIATSHKLKGVAANLSFTNLFRSLNQLLKLLREDKQETIDKEVVAQITEYYEEIIAALKEMFPQG